MCVWRGVLQLSPWPRAVSCISGTEWAAWSLPIRVLVAEECHCPAHGERDGQGLTATHTHTHTYIYSVYQKGQLKSQTAKQLATDYKYIRIKFSASLVFKSVARCWDVHPTTWSRKDVCLRFTSGKPATFFFLQNTMRSEPSSSAAINSLASQQTGSVATWITDRGLDGRTQHRWRVRNSSVDGRSIQEQEQSSQGRQRQKQR